jgi:hypothetical protein
LVLPNPKRPKEFGGSWELSARPSPRAWRVFWRRTWPLFTDPPPTPTPHGNRRGMRPAFAAATSGPSTSANCTATTAVAAAPRGCGDQRRAGGSDARGGKRSALATGSMVARAWLAQTMRVIPATPTPNMSNEQYVRLFGPGSVTYLLSFDCHPPSSSALNISWLTLCSAFSSTRLEDSDFTHKILLPVSASSGAQIQYFRVLVELWAAFAVCSNNCSRRLPDITLQI